MLSSLAYKRTFFCRGVDFGIPGRWGKDEILAEFEMFYQKFEHFTSHSKDAMLQFRSSLEALAHDYANKATDTPSFSLGREHLKALKELKVNKSIFLNPNRIRARPW